MPEKPKRVSPSGRPIIERPRLLKRLDETNVATVLLIAPAGYGKTTLLRQWAKRHPAVCWYTAETGSSDPALLAIGLARALEGVSQGLYEYLSQVVRALSNPSRQVADIVSAFITSLADSPATTVVIDDYHLLSDSHSAETLVRLLRERLNLRLFIASRARPEWASARAEIYGDIVEIGPDELALSANETTEVLAETSGAAQTSLLAQANGWPAVIGLAALAKPSGRTPRDTTSSTLFRFFAEELFTAAPESLQEQLPAMALLPSLSQEIAHERFGDDAAGLLEAAVTQGFATLDGDRHELHPLIREYLLSKLGVYADVEERVAGAVSLSLRLEDWDHAFALITRFGRVDLLESLIEAAFKPLIRSGRIGTLDQIATFARSRSADFSPLVTLIDAELAFRDGRFARTEMLAVRASDALASNHALSSRSSWLAGQAAQLQSNYATAPKHFGKALEISRDEDDKRDALWGLFVTSISSERTDEHNAFQQLLSRQDDSPTDLLRATTALMLHRRYTTGFRGPIDVESALRVRESVGDPAIRASFPNTYAYELLLRSEYRAAWEAAELTAREAVEFQLTWALPHAEWTFAASSLGSRELAKADNLLRRVERRADAVGDGHLILNSAVLRARLFLVLKRPNDAREALMLEDGLSANPAMLAEVLATRALVLAVTDQGNAATQAAVEAAAMTTAVEVQALVACVHAVIDGSQQAALAAFETALRLDVWDPLLYASRASPSLLQRLGSVETHLPRLRALLLQGRDFDLARYAGIELGTRRRSRSTRLTSRESDVLELIRQGLTNGQIAQTLYISEATVKVHVRHILEKVGARTRTEAATREFDD